MIFSLIGSILGLIPGLENTANQWHSAALEAQVKQYMMRLGCDRDTAVALIQANAQVQTKWWFVAVLPVLWAIPFVVYTWKGVAYDNVWCMFFPDEATCTTPALHGDLQVIFVMVVGFYFAHGMSKS